MSHAQPVTPGDIYTVAGDGTAGFSGNGGPATAAELSFPTGVAVDGIGDLLVSDTSNERIRVAAANSGMLFGRAVTAGNIYNLAGNGHGGFSGDGNPATSARLRNPLDITLDGAGNLLIADYGNGRIRVVAASPGTFYGQAMTAGHIYTIAGNGTQGLSGNGVPAISAKISDPAGVAVDAAGNPVIALEGNDKIRVVAASPGTFYGKKMIAGNIYTIAGNGTRGFSGDGSPATKAELLNCTFHSAWQ